MAIRVFRERPNFIPQPDSLTIDEGCGSAALHGVDKPYKLWLFEIGEHREVTFSRIVGSVVERGVNRTAANPLQAAPAEKMGSPRS